MTVAASVNDQQRRLYARQVLNDRGERRPDGALRADRVQSRPKVHTRSAESVIQCMSGIGRTWYKRRMAGVTFDASTPSEPAPPVCTRCGASDVQAMIVTDVTVFWYCPTCGQIWGVPQGHRIGPRLNRQDALGYLRVESASLAKDCSALRHELETILRAPFDMSACVTYRKKLWAYRGLLANHALAVRWTTLSSHVVIASSARSIAARPAA